MPEIPAKLSTDPETVRNSSYNCEKGPNPRVLINALETGDGAQKVCNSSYNYEKGPNPRVFTIAKNALETVHGPQNSMQ